MNKALPDKWIRKAVFDAINNVSVGGSPILCFDMRVTGDELPEAYTLLSSQGSQVEKSNKCEDFYNSQLLIEIFTSYERQGNTGSRVLADDILDMVRNLTQDLQLDPASNLEIIMLTQDFPEDLVTVTANENIFRKFLRLELTIK